MSMLYPTQTPSRLVSDLSGLWDFKLDDGVGFDEKWYDGKLVDPDTMPVPASYNDIKEDEAYKNHYGWVWYQREFGVPAFARSQRVMLRCNAVTHKAKVYINGELVCEHKGGFLPFEVDITDKVTGGVDLLTIAVDNVIDYTTLPVGGKADMLGGSMLPDTSEGERKPQNHPNFDFFNYCGITRPVVIYTTPKDYIEDVSVVPAIDGSDATLTYTVETVGEGDCKVELFDDKGNKVAEAAGATGTLEVKDAHLWWPGEGYQYEVRVTFGEDVYTLPYGIRTVRVDGTKFLINERPFYFKGYGKHEDTFPAGRGQNMPMYAKDISLMKWQGANSFRTSHYPYSEEMMRLCDAEGIVVIDETTAVGVNAAFGGGANFEGQGVSTFDPENGIQTFDHHKEVIRDLINRDKNHACVVMWSIANEPDSTSEGAYDYFKPLFDLAHELDPQNRPCTLVDVQSGKPVDQDVASKLADVICLNRYYGWYTMGNELDRAQQAFGAELEQWGKLGKPVMMTEYGADTVIGLHDTCSNPSLYTEEYQVEYYKANNAVLDKYDFVVGEQIWNFADFITVPGLLRVQGNKKGLFTRDRRPKLAAHYFRNRWTNMPDFLDEDKD